MTWVSDTSAVAFKEQLRNCKQWTLVERCIVGWRVLILNKNLKAITNTGVPIYRYCTWGPTWVRSCWNASSTLERSVNCYTDCIACSTSSQRKTICVNEKSTFYMMVTLYLPSRTTNGYGAVELAAYFGNSCSRVFWLPWSERVIYPTKIVNRKSSQRTFQNKNFDILSIHEVSSS